MKFVHFKAFGSDKDVLINVETIRHLSDRAGQRPGTVVHFDDKHMTAVNGDMTETLAKIMA